MNIALWGKQLFNRNLKVMYDFAQHGLLSKATDFIMIQETDTLTATTNTVVEKKKRGRKPTELRITPKGLFQLGSLNDRDFKINADKEYLKKEICNLETKLKLVYPTKHKQVYMDIGGQQFVKPEVESMIERLKNRLRIKEFDEILGKYPHTTSKLIKEVVDGHKYLRCVPSQEFVPDFPSEAVQAMKEFNVMSEKLCGNKSVFYVIADKKDTEEKNRRRDPILLAQSPFGFFWNILGAWDEEIKFLDEL